METEDAQFFEELETKALLGVDDKTISEFVDRNQPYITEYLEKLMKVEVNMISKTLQERQEIEDKVFKGEYGSFPPSREILEATGFKPFYEYDKLLIDCINKIAKNEKKGFFSEDYSFREDEVRDPSKWLLRVRQSKNSTVWLMTYDMLVSFVKDIHDKRVAEAKTEYANRNKAS
ncbi:MAG: hypothetical protein P4M11_05650 [Candidatus Pacebacteria bacterium]|nr:hypothetical protein [Candidatus Paceibacterota bacterium]